MLPNRRKELGKATGRETGGHGAVCHTQPDPHFLGPSSLEPATIDKLFLALSGSHT